MPRCIKVQRLGKDGQKTGNFALIGAPEVTDRFRVEFATPDATPLDAAGATDGTTSIPAFGASLAGSGGGLKCLKKTASNLSALQWQVDCTFGVLIPGIEPAPATPNPSGERWAINISRVPVAFEVEIQRTRAGKLIVNTAGDPITGLTEPNSDHDLIVAFTTNLVDVAGIAAAYGPKGYGCVNSADVTMTINGQSRTFAAGTLRFLDDAENTTIDPSGLVYIRMTYRLRIRPAGWTRKVANMGLYGIFIDDVTGEAKHSPILDDALNPVTSPVYLSTFPSIASPVEVTRAGVGVDAEILSFDILETADLATVLLWDIHT